ncbi:MAG TPA: 2-amino-4-oxopentanoate thiolase subunit OrtA [Halanaerobiales bacterium]|nr:2-amino-4-oxopentanoate thiolase subunit OrtA [Halanaerobiales bacterium]
MGEVIKAGSWVQIYQVVLPAGERAPQVPEDTQKVPLELKVKGFLQEDAELGDEVEIKTVIGRTHKGELIEVNPPYEHKFGKMIPELLQVGPQIRKILRDEEV